jgi:hypothetical protein
MQDFSHCDYCGDNAAPIVATLADDKDIRVCRTCHADPQIPTRKLRSGE